ncbi:hypothetical protein [Tepidiforma sp.]|jgi:hypothetical protein|uniref:hypothetical protein n=1 Tax=Tepidiforma sp. TaxID=2682230 RepID=UPI00260B2864|nr:hypothetical protein [Tepidiforma sp.]MCX7618065.1 hypothetical protein [Tepidiforma sp.]
MTAATPTRPFLAAAVPWLALAVLIELLLLRTGTRLAIHVPAGRALETPYLALAALGRFAFFVALVLAVLIAAAAVVDLWVRGDAPARVAAVCLGGFAAAAGLLLLLPGASPMVAAAAAIAAIALAAAVVPRGGLVPAVPFSLLGFSLIASAAYAATQASPALPSGAAVPLLDAAEAAGLAAGAALPLALCRRPGFAAAGFGAAAALGALTVFAAPAASGRIILLWNGGVTGALPPVLYAAAAAGFAAAAWQAWRRGERMLLAAFALLFAGGLGFHNTYQSLLLLDAAAVGALFIARPVPVAAPQPSPAPLTAPAARPHGPPGLA